MTRTEDGRTYTWDKGFIIVEENGKEIFKALDVCKDKVLPFHELKKLVELFAEVIE